MCFAVCPSDMATALAVLGASLEITGAQGVRNVPIHEFFTTLGNILEPDEILTNIQFPHPMQDARQVFIKFTIREPVDFAVVSVALIAALNDGVCTEARIALGAVAPTPLRAFEAEQFIKGKAVNEKTIADAAKIVVADAKPMRMNAYKVEITRTLVERALRSVLQ